MKHIPTHRNLVILSIFLTVGVAAAAPPETGTYISIQDMITTPDGDAMSAERGLFFVPENRANPESDVIPIHFIRFPALRGKPRRPPVFLLAGGPGSDYDFSDPVNFKMAQQLRQTRDVVYVSQRGNPRAPSLVPPLYFPLETVPLDEADSAEKDERRLRDALTEAQQMWTGMGRDLAGYDILNIVDDVYELRAVLGYEQIVLRACSFGSQWSFAYMKRWPETVDRALLDGVEPLNYAYDSPDWLWASMSRLAALAESDPHLAPYIPQDGLMAAVKEVLARLEHRPVTVKVVDHAGTTQYVTVGPQDLRWSLRTAFGETPRDIFENWPRFLLELYQGDYRYLAALTLQARHGENKGMLIGLLIDNSLGITARRDTRLLNETAARWLGDINSWYRYTRDLTATPVVDDAFRADAEINVPILLVNGDLDWSTPLENAEHARKFLTQGHLLVVKGGAHCPLDEELENEIPEVAAKIRSFVDADFGNKGGAEDFFATLPKEVSLPAFEFQRPVGPSLYEQWLQGAALP